METKFIYDLMLNYFVSDDELRPAMRKIHNGGNGFLYASDGHILIRLKQEKCMKRYDEIPKYPDAEKLIREAIEREENKKAVINTNDLIRLLSEASWRRLQHGDPCKECDGEGEIECEHCGHKSECNNCYGTGKIMRIKEFSLLQCKDYYYCIKIGKSAYKADYLYIIATMAQMCLADEIQYLYERENNAGIFSFDGVDILLMPYSTDRAEAEVKIS